MYKPQMLTFLHAVLIFSFKCYSSQYMNITKDKQMQASPLAEVSLRGGGCLVGGV